MSPPSADKPPFPEAQNPNQWRFTWEAQSHTPTLRLLLFNPTINPSAQCTDLQLNLLIEQSLLVVSFSQSGTETVIRVPIPRVLVDPESPLHFRGFDDHIEVKLVLLLPVDNPLVLDFDSVLNFEGNRDEVRPLVLDSDLKKLSCMEVYFYCRSCSAKLTKGLSCFQEMPSVNWREVADNWFGNCCCSFGGVSEKLVAKYVRSYACEPGVCLLSTTSVLLCKNDLLVCKFLDVEAKQLFASDLNIPSDSCSGRVSTDEVCTQAQAGCAGNHKEGLSDSIKSFSHKHNIDESPKVVDNDNLSLTFPALKIEENIQLKDAIGHVGNCDTGYCTQEVSESKIDSETAKLHVNQKVFLDGFLGDGFMVRSYGLSRDIQWNEFLCPHCSCLVGTYPSFEDNVPLDGGIRLFKCYVSTSLPSSGSDDVFRNYSQERMFINQLLESAEDELSFRTIVRDIKTKSPRLQIVLLNPNSWGCNGYLDPTEAAANVVMYPTVKLLYSVCNPDKELNSKSLEDWVTEKQADEVYMFSSQILELVQAMDVTNSLSPPSHRSLQGMYLSSMRR